MKPTATHAAEDRLLEYAYGELSPGDAAAVEGHLQGCVKCAGTLDAIRGVRRARPTAPCGDGGWWAWPQRARWPWWWAWPGAPSMRPRPPGRPWRSRAS